MSSRNVSRRAMIVAALLASTPLTGEAQPAGPEPNPLPPGVRVRVTVDKKADPDGGGSTYVGNLAEWDPEALHLKVSDSKARDIPREAIVRLERSVRRGRKGRAALIGFGLGFATFFTWEQLAAHDSCFRGGNYCGFEIAASALLALPVAGVSAIVAPGEQWADVPLHRPPNPPAPSRDAGLQLRLAPVTDGRGAGLVITGSF
jgi:hypothetical protein